MDLLTAVLYRARRWWHDHSGGRILIYIGVGLALWCPLTVIAVVGLYRVGR